MSDINSIPIQFRFIFHYVHQWQILIYYQSYDQAIISKSLKLTDYQSLIQALSSISMIEKSADFPRPFQ